MTHAQRTANERDCLGDSRCCSVEESAIPSFTDVSSCFIVQELCESRGGRPGLSCPNEPSGFRERKDLLNRASALVTTCP